MMLLYPYIWQVALIEAFTTSPADRHRLAARRRLYWACWWYTELPAEPLLMLQQEGRG